MPIVPPEERVPSTQLTPEEVSALLDGKESAKLCEQAEIITALNFQQAINCCGFTSVAYALTAIGCPTTVDEIFLTVGANVESAVGDGMTLAEIHDATLRYVSRQKLPIFVECYHFDDAKSSVEGFKAACTSEGGSGVDDVVVLNFHSGIAHGWASGGGGHFSVLTAYEHTGGGIIMADVHGIKYGTYWSTPIAQMYDAMNDKDSCGRARGALRFGRTDKQLAKPLSGLTPTLVDWTDPPSTAYKTAALAKYIPFFWDTGLGVKNMEGCSTLAAAMRILEGDEARAARLDAIMRVLRESYTFHLNNFLSAAKIAEMAEGLNENGLTSATASVVKVPQATAAALKETLEKVGCGTEGVAVLVKYDLNKAYGGELLPPEKGEAGALTHGTRSWSLLAGFDKNANPKDPNGVLISPTHNVILAGRLWTCSLESMAAAMCDLADGDGNCNLVVLKKS